MKRSYSFLHRTIICIIILFSLNQALSAQQIDMDLISDIKARCIGPAGMSGRVAAIDAVAENPDIFFVGAATGGLWKTVNGGITFEPVFDDQPVSSIGAVAIFQKNPAVVWVGTGEGGVRNSAGVGFGLYKSIDGGDTWNFMGLSSTERINRIVLHPENPDIAYVAAMGAAWGENTERGIYKTVDGGKNWSRILYVDEKTGATDIVIDPDNPNKLFASMWEFRRWPWSFKSGGEGSGLFVTYDGGENWKEITTEEGMPKDELGRIGIAIARSNPDVVYAVVESKKNVLLRSDDGGKSWETVNRSNMIHGRPFYYTNLRVDPLNENRLFSVQSLLWVSEDGGKNFEVMLPFARIHPDYHALWINPIDGKKMIAGNDGGIAVTPDRGKSWRFLENLPLAQFYHINIDNDLPYHVYGGLQDNGSWRGPGFTLENDGIRNYYWEEIAFGDGFAALPDPENSQMGYGMSQGGYLVRWNNITGERKSIRPDSPDGTRLRFNWNAGIAQDPFDPATIYYGSQFVHKSPDRGNFWTVISPDLTTNDPEKQKQAESGGLTRDVTAAENFTSIMTIAPSPVQQGVIWVGTDDGNLQLTLDEGESWTNIVDNIEEVPEGTWIPHIEASKHNAGTAYVVFDDHRRSNWETYVFKTDNFGHSWKNLAQNKPSNVSETVPWGFVHVIEEDPVNPNLLFLGTEFGMYVSFDGGGNWNKWTYGLPTVPVRAIIVHPEQHDLIIGTHGRAVYVIDDIRPLREIAAGPLTNSTLHLFEIPTAYNWEIKQVGGTRFTGDDWFKGGNKPFGAMISYVFNPVTESEEDKDQEVIIEITDNTGDILRKFKGTNKKGINRVTWGFEQNGIKFPGASSFDEEFPPPGFTVTPGTYTVRLTSGDASVSKDVEVHPDPRVNYTNEDYRLTFDAVTGIEEKLSVITEAVDRIRKVEKVV
ncbi:MAG: hypothetical protein GY863_23950, partial [bacterium]|nr:hypothetical protein [bacterium]